VKDCNKTTTGIKINKKQTEGDQVSADDKYSLVHKFKYKV
jgi:hypothetical protein